MASKAQETSTTGISRRAALAGGMGLAASAMLPLRARAAPAPRTLVVAAFPAIDEIVRAALPQWQQLHPEVELKVVSRESNDHHAAMITGLSTSAGLPDVMALEITYLGRFAQGSGLENLAAEPYRMDRERARYVRYAVDQATNARGEIVAAPTDIGPGTLLYRHDLLGKAGLAEPALTASWDSYVAAGLKLKAATGAFLLPHARDMKDILIRSGIPPGEGLYFGQGGTVLVDSPRFVRAFELARRVRQHKLDARVVAWSSDWTEGFKRGTIATQMSGAWLAGHLNNWLAPGTRGLWRSAQLPEGSFAAYGGTFFAMPRAVSAERKRLGWDFIRLMTQDRAMQLQAFKSQDAFPAALETYDDPFFAEPIAFLGGQRARETWREAARHIAAVQVHKQDAFADEVINTELDKVLEHGKPVAAALADAKRLLIARARR